MFLSSFFFFNDTATTEIYPLSLHDALPILIAHAASATAADVDHAVKSARAAFDSGPWRETSARSEEHTSELQSQSNIVCRLLLEKKKKKKTISLQSIYATYSLPDEYRHMVA